LVIVINIVVTEDFNLRHDPRLTLSVSQIVNLSFERWKI
jgi:hypothetical protein